VKKFLSILLLSIYLISTTELSQLLKLNLLVEHFMEHKQADKTLTILQFLNMHYAQENVKDADYEKDMKLPFKTLNTSNSPIMAFFQTETLVLKNKSLFKNNNETIVYNSKFLVSSYLSNIWNPPKNC